MMKRAGIFLLLSLLAAGGCATVPIGPTVLVMPGPGKSFDQFQADDAACRQWAAERLGISPKQTYYEDYVWTGQRMYNNSYVVCMYAKGNVVPGAPSSAPRTLPPPPPPDLSREPSAAPGAAPYESAPPGAVPPGETPSGAPPPPPAP